MVDAAAGDIVMTWNEGMGWRDDWDGEVHMNLNEGREALAACSAAGYRCVLARLVVEEYGLVPEAGHG